MHARQGLGYEFPDFEDPIFAASAILEADGQAQAAGFLKITAEAFFSLNPDYGTPENRWQALLRIHESIRQQALRIGLQDVNLWAPPEVPEGFLRKLERLGWTEDRPWRTFTFKLR